VNRIMLAVLISAAVVSLAPGKGTAPWRSVRVYGWEIMSKEERREFRAEMHSYTEYEDQLAFWREHVARMKQRAWDRGLLLEEPPEIVPANAPPNRRPIYAQYLMTGEEIEAYRAKEMTLRTQEEWEAFVREHEVAMKARALERGLPIGPTPEERKREKKAEEEAKKARQQAAADKHRNRAARLKSNGNTGNTNDETRDGGNR